MAKRIVGMTLEMRHNKCVRYKYGIAIFPLSSTVLKCNKINVESNLPFN